jgi:hypothetical protein
MKWYNKNRTTMVDLTSVKYYHYDAHNCGIDILIDSNHLYFNGNEAESLYKELGQLTNNKQLLTEEQE